MNFERLFQSNCSTLFMIKPVTGIDTSVLGEHGLINSYLHDIQRDDLIGQDLLFILFKPIDFDYFELFLYQQSKDATSFLEDYDYEGGYVVLVYRIPSILKRDFELFKKGKYSKLSAEIKDSYPKSVRHNIATIPTFQHRVFSKEQKLREELEKYLGINFSEIYQDEREVELWQAPNIDKETISQKLLETLKTQENDKLSENKEGIPEKL